MCQIWRKREFKVFIITMFHMFSKVKNEIYSFKMRNTRGGIKSKLDIVKKRIS